MEAEEPFVLFQDGFRKTVEVHLGLENAEPEHTTPGSAIALAGDNLLSAPDFMLCLVPLLRRWLPVASVRYHSIHVEFLGLASLGERVLFEIRVEKQALGKGWKIVVRCRSSSGEYAAVAELLASVPPGMTGTSL
jgi:hypothetical protein